MPPFAGPAGPSLPPSVSLPRTAIPRGGEQHLPDAPRFEPLINPKILAVGIVGALVLAGAALLLARLAPPGVSSTSSGATTTRHMVGSTTMLRSTPKW